jgi:hypothetical protein
VEEVLSSADNMSRASAPDMTSRILLRAHTEQMNKEDSAKVVWRMAASVALLIGLNVGSLLVYNSYHPTEHGQQNLSVIFDAGDRSRGRSWKYIFWKLSLV